MKKAKTKDDDLLTGPEYDKVMDVYFKDPEKLVVKPIGTKSSAKSDSARKRRRSRSSEKPNDGEDDDRDDQEDVLNESRSEHSRGEDGKVKLEGERVDVLSDEEEDGEIDNDNDDVGDKVGGDNDDDGEDLNSEELAVLQAEEKLRKYWDRSFESDDTIERIRKGEARVMEKRKEIPYLAELIGVDTAGPVGHRTRWVYKLKNPLVEAYVNIGRSHDNYIYPLHVDLSNAVRANIISRLHASVRFNLEKFAWEVQVFGRNGVEFPAWGWCLPAEYDDEVWRPLRAYANNRFTIGEVEFEIRRNPIYSNDRMMAEFCKPWAGSPEDSPVLSKASSKKTVKRTVGRRYSQEDDDYVPDDEESGLSDFKEALESAEEDDEGRDVDLDLRSATTRLMSVPPRGTSGQAAPGTPAIEDEDPLDLLNLLQIYPPPVEESTSVGTTKKARRDGKPVKEGEIVVDDDDENVEVVPRFPPLKPAHAPSEVIVIDDGVGKGRGSKRK